MNLQKVKLKRLSICPCGYAVLDDKIKLGTEYTLDLDTIQNKFTYRCGKCGTIQRDVIVVKASQVLHPERPMSFLLYGLFLEPS